MAEKKDYRTSVAIGDVVKMPNGEYALVIYWDIICAGHVKEVQLMPLFYPRLWQWSFWKGLSGYFSGRYRVCENDINKLRKCGELKIWPFVQDIEMEDTPPA